MANETPDTPDSDRAAAGPPKRAPKKAAKKKTVGKGKKSRTPRIYPALTFEECLTLAEAIQMHASGERVSRLTLLKAMNMSPTSSATQILITSSGKYGLTKGSFAAEHLELTPKGRIASDKTAAPRPRAQARFDLAIKSVSPFSVIYDRYKGKKLPSHEVMRDVLAEAKLEITDATECIDTFVVNAKFVGLLQTIAGSETIVPIETLLEQLPAAPAGSAAILSAGTPAGAADAASDGSVGATSQTSWDKICFYITPIGDEDSEHRRHSDLLAL